jgi:FMN phosphatase YigB (HAD superfamily)
MRPRDGARHERLQRDAGPSDQARLAPLLRASLLSCEVGVLKPRPGIYLKALEKLELPPQDCIYVGDGSDRELEGAKAVGLFAVRMLAHRRPPYSTRESLDWDATVHSLGELIERLVPRSSNETGSRCRRGPTDT